VKEQVVLMNNFNVYRTPSLIRRNDAYRAEQDKTKAWQTAVLTATAVALAGFVATGAYFGWDIGQKIQAYDSRIAGKQNVSDKTQSKSDPANELEIQIGGD